MVYVHEYGRACVYEWSITITERTDTESFAIENNGKAELPNIFTLEYT